jgi:hypothetical protein
MYHFFHRGGAGHIQSVIFGSMCLTIGMLFYMMGVIADLVATNRKLSEKILQQLRKTEDSNNGRGQTRST